MIMGNNTDLYLLLSKKWPVQKETNLPQRESLGREEVSAANPSENPWPIFEK